MGYRTIYGDDEYDDFDPEAEEEEYYEMVERAISEAEDYSLQFSEKNVDFGNGKYIKISENEFITKIVGVTYDNRQEAIKKLYKGREVSIIRDANNAFDSNAVAVYDSGNMLGHLPAELAPFVAVHLDNGLEVYAEVVDSYGGNGYSYGAKIIIRLLSEKTSENNNEYDRAYSQGGWYNTVGSEVKKNDISRWDGMLISEIEHSNGVESFQNFVAMMNSNGFIGRLGYDGSEDLYKAELTIPERAEVGGKYLNIEFADEGKLSRITYRIRGIITFGGGNKKNESDFFSNLNRSMNFIEKAHGSYSSFSRHILFENEKHEKYYWISVDAYHSFCTYENSILDIDSTLFKDTDAFYSSSIMHHSMQWFLEDILKARKFILSNPNLNWKIK